MDFTVFIFFSTDFHIYHSLALLDLILFKYAFQSLFSVTLGSNLRLVHSSQTAAVIVGVSWAG